MKTQLQHISGLFVFYRHYRSIAFLIILSAGLVMTINSCQSDNPVSSVVWKLDNHTEIGGYSPVVIGNPKIVNESTRTFLSFNGESDGIIVPLNPVYSWDQFTVEVLFYPSSDGRPEQRFVHFMDKKGNRGLIETRVTSDGKWYLDTYLHDGAKDEGYTLADREKLHPCDEWFWAALVYDGITMRHYINAVEELSGEFEFGPMETGMISLGVRLNQVYWFKGNISEVRFHPRPLNAQQLQNSY